MTRSKSCSIYIESSLLYNRHNDTYYLFSRELNGIIYGERESGSKMT